MVSAPIYWLRPVTPADVDAMYAMEQDVARYPWTRTMFADEVVCADSYGWVVMTPDCGELAGFLLVRRVIDEWQVMTLAVDRRQHRHGWGRCLMNWLLRYAVTTTLVDLGLPAVVLLEVAADNLPAQALYDALGFVVIHRRRNYYLRQIGETVVAVDALLMRWTAAGDGEQRGED